MTALEVRRSRIEWVEPGRLARLVLDEGRGNVLDLEALAALRAMVAELGGERSLRALVIDHAGEHFSFGASVSDHLPERAAAMLAQLHGLARELLALDVPLLASVRGRCLGAGLELVLLAERVFVAPGAILGQPEVRLGVFAPLGSLLLPRAVGSRSAAELLLSGRTVDAGDALALGLASEIADDPCAAAVAWHAEHLAAHSAVALRFATRALRRAWVPAFLAELADLERMYLEELVPTRDGLEGLTAFLEKREPRWEDR